MLDRLFVYGTLRPRGRAFSLVKPKVVDHRPAVLSGYSLVGEGHRYPWCIKSPGSEVTGDLLWLREVEETLRMLDEYEGVEDPDPEYVRTVADVMTGARLLPAWVYVGSMAVPGDVRPVDGGEWIP
ncbi:MAG: gamma-glutamylcyclotransferase [Actinomycetota bacterium]